MPEQGSAFLALARGKPKCAFWTLLFAPAISLPGRCSARGYLLLAMISAPTTALPAHDLGPGPLLQLKPLSEFAGAQTAHRHNFFEVLVLHEAAGTQQIDFVEFPLVAGRVYFIGAGQVHTLHATRLEGWLLAFDPALLDHEAIGRDRLSVPALFHNWRRPYIDLNPATGPTFSALLVLLQQEYAQAEPCWQTLRTYLQAFLLNAERASVADASASTPTLPHAYLDRLHELLEQHYATQHHAAFYAAQVGLSLKRLNDYTRQAAGRSVTQLLHERLLVESKRLLLYSSLTVKEIAYAVGFQDPAYFSRFFKNKTTYYPERFRQDWVKSPTN